MTYPIVYKKIPTQYAFYVEKNGELQIQIVTPPPTRLKFKSEKEAREFIKKYNEQI
jgi:hypothetical protein